MGVVSNPLPSDDGAMADTNGPGVTPSPRIEEEYIPDPHLIAQLEDLLNEKVAFFV